MNGQEEIGTVKWFDSQKGYGFIRRENGSDVFVHFSAIEDPNLRDLQEGDRVQFVVGPGRKGPAAQQVRRASE